MKRRLWATTALMMTFFIGCGGGDKQTAEGPPPANSTQSTLTTTPVGSTPTSLTVKTPIDPKEIVSVFLDAMRAGNGEQLAVLFTKAAREEIKRQGIQIQPPGSSNATFQIGEVERRDQEILVQSTWLEPQVDGQPPQTMEVVWVLHQDPEGWRVSGMAVATGPGEDDIELVDFEHLEEPAQEQPAAPQSRVANLPNAPVGGNMPAPGGYNASMGGNAPTGFGSPQPSGLPQGGQPQNGLPQGGQLQGGQTGLPSGGLPGTNAPGTNLPGANPASGAGAPNGLPPLPGSQPSGGNGLPPANFR